MIVLIYSLQLHLTDEVAQKVDIIVKHCKQTNHKETCQPARRTRNIHGYFTLRLKVLCAEQAILICWDASLIVVYPI